MLQSFLSLVARAFNKIPENYRFGSWGALAIIAIISWVSLNSKLANKIHANGWLIASGIFSTVLAIAVIYITLQKSTIDAGKVSDKQVGE